jgi:glutathione synthase/RimK-type ligase-like ATP-grasp enzyme
MLICYSGKTALSARAIAEQSDEIELVRGRDRVIADINWGRYKAETHLNPDISNSTNKRVMRELFREAGVPMPKLYSYQEVYELLAPMTPEQHSLKFVGRPDSHSKGRGLWVIKELGDLRRALDGTRTKKAATHFMEFIDAPREYRVHIFMGKSIRISEKVYGDEEHPKTHQKLYTTGKPKHPVKHVRKAAKKAIASLGLDFGAVDILADDDNCWVLEVNAAPGLGGTMPKLYAEVFTEWMEGEWDE